MISCSLKLSSQYDLTYQYDLIVVTLLENFKLLVNKQVHGPRIRWLALASVVVLSIVIAIKTSVRSYMLTYL